MIVVYRGLHCSAWVRDTTGKTVTVSRCKTQTLLASSSPESVVLRTQLLAQVLSGFQGG